MPRKEAADIESPEMAIPFCQPLRRRPATKNPLALFARRFAQKVSAKLRAMNATKKSVVSRWPFAEVIMNAPPSPDCQAAGGLAPSGDRLRIAPKERKPRRL